MRISHRYSVTMLLGVSALLLASLIPGGPVENRDFSHLQPLVLGSFNLFLTGLNFGSIVLMLFTLQGRAWAFRWAAVAAVLYFAVYAIDLARLFPQSPTPMPALLGLIEVAGMVSAVPLLVYSCSFSPENDGVRAAMAVSVPRRWVAISLLLVGSMVVWFATDAAMHSGDGLANSTASVSDVQRGRGS